MLMLLVQSGIISPEEAYAILQGNSGSIPLAEEVDTRYHITVMLAYKPELIDETLTRKGLNRDDKIEKLEVIQ